MHELAAFCEYGGFEKIARLSLEEGRLSNGDDIEVERTVISLLQACQVHNRLPQTGLVLSEV